MHSRPRIRTHIETDAQALTSIRRCASQLGKQMSDSRGSVSSDAAAHAAAAAESKGSSLPQQHESRVQVTMLDPINVNHPARYPSGMVSYTAWHPAGLDRWPHLHLDCACRCHICTGTGPHLGPATSAPGLGSPPPHLHRDWTSPCHICAGTGLTPPTSAPGLGSPRPHLRRDWAHPAHICTGDLRVCRRRQG